MCQQQNFEKMNQLAFRMTKALISALIVGVILIFIRKKLIQIGHEDTWLLLHMIFFQDISTPEGNHALGIFYLLGQLFINALQLIIMPMVFCSIALAMCHISDTKKLGRLSFKTLLGFFTTSVFALLTASLFGFMIYKRGLFNVSLTPTEALSVASSPNPLMVILEAVPNNITTAFSSNSRVLAIVFLAVITGLCMNAIQDELQVLKKLLLDLNGLIHVFLNFVILKFSPLAVFILITRTFAVYGTEHLKPALIYIISTICIALLYLILGYPLYIFLVTGLNPFIFMKKIAKVGLLAFSANSSAAALSLNEKTTITELGVEAEIASFILPLGMTINMNGTAITQVMATFFIAASSGYELSLKNVVLIAILAFIASVGTPAAPGASAIILFSILNSMGYHNESTLIAYTLIIAINRPVDMVNTSLNVVGDAATAVVVAASEKALDEKIYYA